MTLADEIKRCIEACRSRGLVIEKRLPPSVKIETIKRRYYGKNAAPAPKKSRYYVPPIKHTYDPAQAR